LCTRVRNDDDEDDDKKRNGWADRRVDALGSTASSKRRFCALAG